MSIHIASHAWIHLWLKLMDFKEFASDLPPDRTSVFERPEDLEQALQGCGVIQPTRQSKRGKFRAALATRSTETCELFADRYSTALSLHCRPPPGGMGIMLPRSVSGQFMAAGFKLGDEHFLVLTEEQGADIVGPGPIGSDDISIPEARFFKMLNALCPTVELDRKLRVVEVPPDQLRLLGSEVVGLIGAPDMELVGERLSNLLALTVSTIGHASSRFRPEKLSGKGARVRVARGVQEIIEEQFREPVHMEDLCRETGTGIRTLQRCFNEYFDDSVTGYLKTVRLDSAYRELDAADPGETNVTLIALRNGFTHLGRFSVAFRRRFGQSPSELLEEHGGAT
jgi:AraC-like DNA-binding protein